MTERSRAQDLDWEEECSEWLDSLIAVERVHGRMRCLEICAILQRYLATSGFGDLRLIQNTPYRNTIPPSHEHRYPGDEAIEERLENALRWNAIAMVLRANDGGAGVGGHIATYASAATLLEVGFHHIFRNRSADYGGDIVNIQPHAAPGVYARMLYEGRLTRQAVENFRRELGPGGGLSSYPHPRRMPQLWPCPTASMGLSSTISIHIARFAKYLEQRGLKPKNGGKIWCFLGDGEVDEPEVVGTIGIAARERLENLIFIVNCNLQRLDGPVRGNGKVIQELERVFQAAGWRVIKVIWGSAWDSLLAEDTQGILQARMDEVLDGDYQSYSTLSGAEIRKHWVNGDARLDKLMRRLTDEDIRSITRGGHDRRKIYSAYRHALETRDQPTVILAKTVKGFAMGARGEGRNTAHQKKTMSQDERSDCATRLGIPLSDEEIADAEFYELSQDSEEIAYLRAKRNELGGFQPIREDDVDDIAPPPVALLQDFASGFKRPISTTSVLVRMLSKLLRDPDIGKYIVPIVPDEARTFGMDGLFRQVGIYSRVGQLYRPVDMDTLAPYRESKAGQVLQEGICEAGAIASFIAAGTAYSHFNVPTIPFYFFYSMFGFQRVGDFIWAAGDALCRGFLIGGTAGRTTLNGEGLQHQDGHSHILASTVPSVVSYDPCFAYEVVEIVREGIRRMYEKHEPVVFYLTVYNETYSMPSIPDNVAEGILKGIYCLRPSTIERRDGDSVQLLGSGSVMNQVLEAQRMLELEGIGASVWSVTSYVELYRDAVEADRNAQQDPETVYTPYLSSALDGASGPYIAVTDYMRSLPEMVSKWIPGELITLGTDGFGLSESREALRKHFSVDADSIVQAAKRALAR